MNTWDDVTAWLKGIYLSSFYDDDIWTDIRNRTQGQYETCATYVINMESLFNKLKKKPEESERVNTVRERMLPYIQQRLPLEAISTLSDLLKYSRWIEDVQVRTQRLRPPPTGRHLVTEPDFMYNPRRHHRLEAVSVEEEQSVPEIVELQSEASAGPSGVSAVQMVDTVAAGSRRSNNGQCYNCSETGHFANNCPRPRRKYCYRCGLQDETVRTCRNCSGNAQPSRDQATS